MKRSLLWFSADNCIGKTLMKPSSEAFSYTSHLIRERVRSFQLFAEYSSGYAAAERNPATRNAQRALTQLLPLLRGCRGNGDYDLPSEGHSRSIKYVSFDFHQVEVELKLCQFQIRRGAHPEECIRVKLLRTILANPSLPREKGGFKAHNFGMYPFSSSR